MDERNQRMERIRIEAEAEALRAQEARAARLAAQQAAARALQEESA